LFAKDRLGFGIRNKLVVCFVVAHRTTKRVTNLPFLGFAVLPWSITEEQPEKLGRAFRSILVQLRLVRLDFLECSLVTNAIEGSQKNKSALPFGMCNINESLGNTDDAICIIPFQEMGVSIHEAKEELQKGRNGRNLNSVAELVVTVACK
jgi:hypothetical protein